ncbi:S-adenosyl-L-methionine-dependent methyltransferases superfamily protein [Striga hermonthica]|uniref:S-adenosyl-L-methionine-dependent methyltransferases superfamily protein n=1 Tax=Striga hermonthica TaxID=68872 RepID=A0A9N7NBP8_STRHE|nr:S-adenosyl-L-methionine-dependent methyltransferases superfamily protein [Striga hermonthica]
MPFTSPSLSSCFSFNLNTTQTPTIAKPLNSTLKSAIPSVSCSNSTKSRKNPPDLLGNGGHCSCCPRRHLFGSMLGTGLFPVLPSFASGDEKSPPKDMVTLSKIRPPRPDWYEEFYALAMDKLTKPYEAEIAAYKSQLFAKLKGKPDNILEIGVGTGPNLKYYADYPGVNVFGVDPNRKMEKYAQAAVENAGLMLSNFKFIQGVAEALPVDDASVDVVVGTLVLCSVNDVDQALQEIRRVLKPGGIYIFVEHVGAKDGTILKFMQRILDPLQQTLADGCHLTRNTDDYISRTDKLDINDQKVQGILEKIVGNRYVDIN